LLHRLALKTVLGALFLIVALSASASAGQVDQASGDATFRKGGTEIALLANVGYAMDLWGGLPDSQFLALGLRLGRIVTNPIFAGPCRGNFGISTDLSPAVFFHENRRNVYALSGAVLMRYYFAPSSRIHPFISAGGGMVLSAKPIPNDISRVNFTPLGGGGLAVALHGGPILSFEFRIHHMSNAVFSDYNPGANSGEFLIEVGWVR
jgi:opacity protein-like surface antigen